MTRPEAAIRNISDTALWVAVYRARETERPDAVFRDPFARRLAGKRGEEIAAASEFSQKNEWAFITRTYLFDQFIMQRVQDGADMIVNLAAGLDARPYRMDLPASLQWVEVDLPGMIDYKTSILADEKPHCQLKRVRLDLADVAARRDLFSSLGARAKKVTVICEGLLVYFTEKEVASLARDLAVQPGFNYWVIDIASPGLIRMMNKHMRDALHSAGAPLKFGPEEGPAFFLPHGWKPASIRQMLKSAAKINRLSFFFRLLAALPSSDGPQGNRPWSAVVLYKRTM